MFPWIFCQFIERGSRYRAFGIVSRLRTGQRGNINAISGKEKKSFFIPHSPEGHSAPTHPPPHPANCQMGTGVCLLTVKQPGRQNWQFIPSTRWSRIRGVIYPLTHSLSLRNCLVTTGATLYLQKWEGLSNDRNYERNSEGNWEANSRRMFWPMSFVIINWITTLNASAQIQVLQTTNGYCCFLSVTHPIFYLFASCISQPLIFKTAGVSN
jgi:hypothetical protein